uniref:Uncharacterized protein n=1 Tax=Spongospora subterranea TaxID=70186 RepID=A0A0H5RBD4_9EUKA|eukprot:CRZ11333.1 hypothetical protein [Spongospora subterranea]
MGADRVHCQSGFGFVIHQRAPIGCRRASRQGLVHIATIAARSSILTRLWPPPLGWRFFGRVNRVLENRQFAPFEGDDRWSGVRSGARTLRASVRAVLLQCRHHAPERYDVDSGRLLHD